ncbi:RNA polymerase sigma-70 factor (sigma-E family) [Actinoplanes campanulatus]|uniref:RNA polymerase sigma-70 factor (Sigma-E family) n=1 Tax=Actinoplanes campanulatus TaxID=113559 RepID=A0A7W5FIB1_9ACTN|nr:SigE family RNA polymerase sigma factor [Actinoplanes campanulatus]MBB3099489.1 RNA polymerase sigma-70 factor (sigma-E family) [Actinoplanes campanulatus]GGN42585.1 RNA polymerase sigma24 factor [Actinoplanes campanulatus]GID39838.1 RNA polymerase sigma24 factor [Actinoplanes campanulatus]
MTDRDEAFAEYFAARSSAMRATAFLLCGDWHRAEDLVQQTFTKLYLRWNRVQRHESLDPYVRRVLISTFIDEGRWGWWRRERPQETRIERAAAPEPSDDRVTLLGALARVPARQRAVLVLRYWQDLSVEETAAALGCSAGTVKSQAARGLDTLRTLVAHPVNAD